MHVYLLTRRLHYLEDKNTNNLCYWTVPQSKMKMSTETLLWLESTGSACLSVRYYDRRWWRAAAAATHLCTSPGLQRYTGLLLTVSSSPRKGRVRRGMFTCELFPSVIWSCTFGTRCSRHPYTGPYTWQCISVRTKAGASTALQDSFHYKYSDNYFLVNCLAYNASIKMTITISQNNSPKPKVH